MMCESSAYVAFDKATNIYFISLCPFVALSKVYICLFALSKATYAENSHIVSCSEKLVTTHNVSLR